ncbi:uncharacterized protein MEPE_01501 [Melanopsichium pennsylvanicum]|uniref:Acyl-CoA thioesterase-like N-terminal HotDog domain-containing protein n=2 Tax=Melanopsichium pennsylvanicum TaxID=63383 RepID=A0AAJ4XIK4_9BASI|nr:conserved hypothetical protein [Melanopsichium pennsylvanicum 4]SNX82795.1 uncharacterized protein MEPE_01501 [Melanopsichium pennsylvanicum]
MPGLQSAILSRLDESSITPTNATYTGTIDTTWCIGSVPQGGYSLSIILNAVLAFMLTPELTSTNIKSVPHHDPLILSATYIQAVTWTPYQVRVTVLKRGKSLSNLQAELWQDGVMRITTQVLMTNFAIQKQSADRTKVQGINGKDVHNPVLNGYSVTEESQWAPKFPLSPPEKCEKPRFFGNQAESGKTFGFGNLLTISEDPLQARSTLTSDQLSAGAYYELVAEPTLALDEKLVAKGRLSSGRNLIPFLADMFTSPPMMIPGKHKSHWYPTLHLTIEFKRALPAGDAIVRRTATLSRGRFMINGQHESDSELWSHPKDQHLFEQHRNNGAAEGKKRGKEGERRSYILAIARQTALVLPFAVNQAKTKAKL